MPYLSINPANGEIIKTFPSLSITSVLEHTYNAHKAHEVWRLTNFSERAKLALRIGELLKEKRSFYAQLMSIEMGKVITEALAEVDKCAWACTYYAENGEAILANEIIATDATKSYIAYRPIGAILGIMPWNFPFWQVLRCAIPIILTGNAFVLKHASNVPQCAQAIHDLFQEAGFPEYVFQNLFIESADIAATIANPCIAGVTLTGSEAAGKSVAEAAGRNLKKCVLELGGSDPFIVLADADIEFAATNAVKGRMINTGQSCIAAKRFIVHESVVDEFTEKVVAKLNALKVGDPLEPNSQFGPLARPDLATELADQVQRSVALGAKVLTGGKVFGESKAWFQPTVISYVTPNMPVWNEETFGPVMPIMAFTTEDEALAIANSSRLGLGGSVWSTDTARAEKLAAQIQSGSVFVNGITKSDPRLPFGGVKMSGYGRELGTFGMKEFVNVQTVWVG